ncbi:MAG: hypothetical protein ABSD38_14155 [Syntrophorhabdales bacterium]|jgi:hypothetical protein
MQKDGEEREKGKSLRIFLGARLVLLGMAFLFAGSCAGTMKGYSGPALPAGETALIRAGFDAYILRCDDVRLSHSQLSITVLPGKHTVEISFRRQWVGDKLLLSDVTGSITFAAVAGHTYSVNADLLPIKEWAGLVAHEYDWKGYVKDQGTGQTIAITSEALPVRIEWIYHGSLLYQSM